MQRGLGGVRVVLEGHERGIAMRVHAAATAIWSRRSSPATELPPLDPKDPTFVALHREVRERAAELAKKRGVPDEAVEQMLAADPEPGRLADLVAGYLDVPVAEHQALLEALSIEDRLRRVLIHVQRQIDVLSAQEDIQSKVKEELGDRQRELYLREQLRAIQKELGEGDEAADESLKELKAKLDKLPLPDEARKEVNREWSRLTRAGRESMESQVIRTYLETIAELPWGKRTEELLDVQAGREDPRRGSLRPRRREGSRARVPRGPPARRRRKAEEGPDPPVRRSTRRRQDLDREVDRSRDGTQVRPRSRSAARATRPTSAATAARTSARCRAASSQGMKQAGSKNPVFLLDEVDKLGMSHQGDPASALLEVLDPAQNDSFTDHYLGVPFDLSEVMFIATANFIQNIPGPLLDRMEVVDFAGYTEREKLAIAKQYLVPRQLDDNGLTRRAAHADRRCDPRGDHERSASSVSSSCSAGEPVVARAGACTR